MAAIRAQDWDALACPETATGRPIDPFTTHRFLAALEASGSTGDGTGWQARPLVLRDQGRTVAAMPLYVKGHSQGEYIFDHGWAEAYARAGGRYYPKLQTTSPFTPATGRRLLAARFGGRLTSGTALRFAGGADFARTAGFAACLVRCHR